MILDDLKNRNIDWLVYDKAYMRQPNKSRENRIWVYFKLLMNILISFLRKKPTNFYKGALFYIDNTRHASQAELLIPNVHNAIYHNNTDQIIKGGKEINISNGIFSSYIKLVKYFRIFIEYEKHGKSIVFKNNLPIVINGILLYEHYLEIFRSNEIDVVVIFTDHSYKNRALLFAAKHCNVPTAYIPHASVSEIFPPLEMDVAFLEGMDMKNKYEKIAENWSYENKTEIVLAGNYKTNYYRNLNNGSVKNNKLIIGVTYNTLDSSFVVKKLVDDLLSNSIFDHYSIVLRPHPSITNFLEIDHTRTEMSNPALESSVDFLKRIKFLISGDSNIVLEAALLETNVFLKNLSDSPFQDLYGFRIKNVCPFISELGELIPFIKSNFQNYQFNKELLSFYDASYKGDVDGVSKISNYLNNFSDPNSSNS
ncbi:hypothetical protein [Christiangramia sediminis]|uniref:Uncharacterized protein n=1 Tax=Christiangramia sediminis TaxID=2881336 RepID=A0A9X1RWW2_9FLAO|nr:hypothetical protein [Christiangramia sediminis]MCB7480622.1 hypothetical protein [Christiangramia sediminis]